MKKTVCTGGQIMSRGKVCEYFATKWRLNIVYYPSYIFLHKKGKEAVFSIVSSEKKRSKIKI